MNNVLEHHLKKADGRYLEDLELKPLDDYLTSFTTRLQVYSLLQEKGEAIVLQALRQLAQSDRAIVQEFGEVCKRDLSYGLRTIALAILRDDEAGFREQFVLWMQNIMRSLHKEHLSARAYKILQLVVQEHLPAAGATLVNRYLDLVIEALTAGL